MIKKLSPRLELENGIHVDWEENINDYIDILLKEKEIMKKSRFESGRSGINMVLV